MRSQTSLSDSLSARFLKNKVSLFIFYELTKFHCLVVLNSWNIGKYVFKIYYFSPIFLFFIVKSSLLQMVLCKDFAILWIKKSLQHRCFPENASNFLRTAILQNFSGGCFCILLKVIKQLFRKGYFLKNVLVMTS